MSTLHHPEPARPRTVLGEAFVVSLVIEAVLLAAIAGGFTRQTSKPQPKPPEPIKLMLAAPTPAPPSPAPAKPPVPLKPPAAHPLRQPAVTRRSEKSSVPKPELPQAPAPSEQPEPAHDKAQDTPTPPAKPSPPQPQAEPQPPSHTAQPEAKPSAVFQARLRDAVQASVRYPAAARIMRLTGHVRLGFAYQDGTMSNPRVVQSSGQKMLDEAALAALNSTAFPEPPPELKGHLLNLEIVVTFAPSS